MPESTRPDSAKFRIRLASDELVIGTFIKTPTIHATEILGDLGYDFVVLDDEHAPFDRQSIDHVLMAARAANIAGIVRVKSAAPPEILSALDCGASGVLVPHIINPTMARNTVAACRYRDGNRGFSNSPRAGHYGRLGIWDHVDKADSEVTVVGMIEDPEAIEAIDDIVAVEGLDAVFIGRGDLTVAMNAKSPATTEIRNATETITRAAKRAGKAVCAMTAGGEDAEWLRGLGVNGMIVASDQGFMRQAANSSLQKLHKLLD